MWFQLYVAPVIKKAKRRPSVTATDWDICEDK